MQLIATTFTDRTFVYSQRERVGNIAIYEQRHKLSGVRRYEVVRIRMAPEQTWPDGRVTPEREVYPGSSTWGTWGFTFHKLPEAQQHAQTLQQDAGEPRAAEQGEA